MSWKRTLMLCIFNLQSARTNRRRRSFDAFHIRLGSVTSSATEELRSNQTVCGEGQTMVGHALERRSHSICKALLTRINPECCAGFKPLSQGENGRHPDQKSRHTSRSCEVRSHQISTTQRSIVFDQCRGPREYANESNLGLDRDPIEMAAGGGSRNGSGRLPHCASWVPGRKKPARLLSARR